MYPLNSTGNSVTWNYMISDIDSCLNSNHLYAFVGNEDTAKSSSLIIVGADKYIVYLFQIYLLVRFIQLKRQKELQKTRKLSMYLYLHNTYIH